MKQKKHVQVVLGSAFTVEVRTFLVALGQWPTVPNNASTRTPGTP